MRKIAILLAVMALLSCVQINAFAGYGGTYNQVPPPPPPPNQPGSQYYINWYSGPAYTYGQKGNYETYSYNYQDNSITNLKPRIDRELGVVCFGRYTQNYGFPWQPEEIEWRILDEKDGEMLVVSKNALDCVRFHEKDEAVTWELSTIRKFLNNYFLYTAFSQDEREYILPKVVSADDNPQYTTKSGNAVRDKIFLLSIDEANKYFKSDADRQCAATALAKNHGAWTGKYNFTWWWLRTPGSANNRAARVRYEGKVGNSGNPVVYEDGAVRPAMWIKVDG